VSVSHEAVARLAQPRLSAATRRILDRHIERAMRQRFGSSSNLRQVVRIAATELAAGGATEATIRTVLTRSVEDHPERYTWDRVSILTGLQASDVLTRQVMDWVGEPSAIDSDQHVKEQRSPRRRVFYPSAVQGRDPR
jgi:hypothetical protein